MAAPQRFISDFRKRLNAAGVRFVLTSGQACVFYGIQQTTKDSDWIIEPDDVYKVQSILEEIDATVGHRVSFRAICGAPFSKAFLGNGWTTHVQITDADGDEQLLDFFGRAPRVRQWERDLEEPDYAARIIVAQMKKTDREKDWPFVFALGKQAVARGDIRGILHGQDADWLVQTWEQVPENQRQILIDRRPLLGLIASQSPRLRRAVMIEKSIWQSVNRSRYRAYQQAWKEFFRQWRREPHFQWPTQERYKNQWQILNDAASKYKLSPAPLNESLKENAIAGARHDAVEIFAATEDELLQIMPPRQEMLP